MPRFSRRRHPEAALAAVAARALEQNRLIAERCATPGFGYLVMLYGEDGSQHGRDADTYVEAKAIRDAEMKTGHYYKAWIFPKEWNAGMSITAKTPAQRGLQVAARAAHVADDGGDGYSQLSLESLALVGRSASSGAEDALVRRSASSGTEDVTARPRFAGAELCPDPNAPALPALPETTTVGLGVD